MAEPVIWSWIDDAATGGALDVVVATNAFGMGIDRADIRAVVHVQPERDADGRTIIVRITGGPALPVGSPVNLRARGPVFAWRRD